MPATHRVIITAEALANLEEIAGYIRQHSPQSCCISRASDSRHDRLPRGDAITLPTRRQEQEARHAGARGRSPALHHLLSRGSECSRLIRASRVARQTAAAAALRLAVG